MIPLRTASAASKICQTLALVLATASASAEKYPAVKMPSAIPVVYVQNDGQSGSETLYTARARELTAEFEAVRVRLRRGEDEIALEFLGASLPRLEALEEMNAKANFLIGRDSSAWITNVSTYRGVAYRSLYQGIDAEFSSENGRIKSDYIVQPGVDPRQIRLRYRGALRMEVAEDGGLRIHSHQGTFQEQPPVAYQVTRTGTRYIPVAFALQGQEVATFYLGEYDRELPLHIDPALSYSTYYGGARTDAGMAIAVDSSGNAYVAGYTDSANLPLQGQIQNSAGSVDAFVLKLNTNGTQLVYATYIGGTGDDRAYGIGVDSAGAAYVCGTTNSTGFPVVSAIQAANRGLRDGFLLKLNAAGNGLVYSTYFGGSANDSILGCTVDAFGQFYATGETASTNLTTRFPFQASNAGGYDAFAVKLNASGALVFSTYFGGSGDDSGKAIAIHPTSLTPYIAGGTASANLPIWNPSQPTNAGGNDAFVTRFNGDANGLIYSTYLGGSAGSAGSPEQAHAIAVDSFGNAYVAGVTSSANFPVLNAYQASHRGGQDAFLTKLNSGGARLFSTYLGGSGADIATAIALDANRRPYVAGYTSSVNFPMVLPLQASLAGGYDAFVAEFDINGAPLIFSSYLGGTATDAAYGIAVNPVGEMFLTGTTVSSNFPVQAAYRFTNAGGSDVFVSKITAAPIPPTAPALLSLTPSSGTGASNTFQIRFLDANGANDIASIQVLVNSVFQGVNGCHVVYNHQLGLLYLLNNGGTGWLGGLPPGALNTISNSQCSIQAGASSVTALGNEVTLNLNLSFTPAFAGTRNVYLLAIDNGGLRADWAIRGTWTIP